MLDLTNRCFYYTFFQILGHFILPAVALFLKFPQLWRIIDKGSVYGISRVSTYFDLISWTHAMCLILHGGNSLQFCTDTGVIAAQHFLIVLLIFEYNKEI